MPQPQVTRRTALASLIAAAYAGGLGTGRAAAPERVNVGFFTETKPTMIAKGEEWFAQGLGGPITWTEFASGAEINTAMVAGSCDIGLATGSVATASGISQNLPFQLVGVVDNIGPAEEMTVRASTNIRTPADFRGKKVATPFGSTSHFRLLGFLKTNNLTQRDVTVLDMRPAAIQAAWARNEIDAAYVWAPAKSKLLEAGGQVFRTWDTLDRAGYVVADLIVVRNAFAASYPDAIVGFLKAYGRALEMWRTQPDAAAAIVARQAGVTPQVAKADMEEYDFISLADQMSARWLGAPGQPGAFAGVLKGTADFLVEQRSIRSAPGVEVFGRAIHTEYLQRAVA
ncbi:ABC transporter substrate-binding protein [Muricoccus radiodurans]|uniref:taurine ABC transporter substrate-binding protein n=1 Tax=Muricoccus radiodurans TaxID=2231721 RepID=UPI003CF1DE0F